MAKSIEEIAEDLSNSAAVGPFESHQVEDVLFDYMFDMDSGDSLVLTKGPNKKWFVYSN